MGGSKAPGAPTHTHPASGGCGAGRTSQRQAQRDLAKPNFPPGSPGPPDTSTESIFRRAWKAPGFPGRGRAAEPRGGPVRCPGAESAARRPLCRVPALVAARNPLRGPRPAGRRRLSGPASQCAAPGAGAGPGDAARVAASARASPPPPGPPSWPRPPGAVLPTGAGPSPGAGPRQARPARRAPCVPVAGPHGEGGGGGPRPALGGTAVATSRSRPPPPGSHGVVAGVGTLRSGLAARRLKGVRSGGSRRRRCHRAAVAAAAGRA